jgi:hypothetical protein
MVRLLKSNNVQECHCKSYTIPVTYDSETQLWTVSFQALAAGVAQSSRLSHRSVWDNEFVPTFSSAATIYTASEFGTDTHQTDWEEKMSVI